MALYQCNASLRCKSKTCFHAKPHEASNCWGPAPCGQWPNDPDFKPMVMCIPMEDVNPPEDCPDCGQKEAKGHHHRDCIKNLKRQLSTK